MSESARAAVLGRLRQARAGDDGAKARVEARLADPQPGLIPARAQLDAAGRVALFIAQAEAVQTDVVRVPHGELAQVVAHYLRRHNLPLSAVVAADPLLAAVDWASTLMELRQGRPVDADQVGITRAFAGIAETGTLMLLSDGDHPTMLAFLPETSVVVLPTARVLASYEDGLRQLRAEHGQLPRSVNLITGPSRSGDIEQTILLGAHGPRRLLVVLVDDIRDGD
jgi:L-lactate dehydrogenase complex protein LldG